MADAQVKAFKTTSVQWGVVLQLLFCHCLIVGTAVVFRGQLLPVISACLFSFLLLLNLPYSLHLLVITLDRLTHGFPVEPVAP